MKRKLLRLIRCSLSICFMLGIYYVFKWIYNSTSLVPQFNLPDHLTESSSWVFAVEHHLLQLAFALLFIVLLSKGNWKEWGLNLKNYKESLQIVKKFCYYYLLYFIGISFLIQLFYYQGPPFSYSFNWTQITGYLAFGFILSGLSEEILFRGLMQTFLSKQIAGNLQWKDFEIPIGGFIAVIIFTIAHIGFSIMPFEIWHFNPLQLLQAFILGLFYAWAYHKTKSLLAPILAHNISNGSIWLMDYLLYMIHI